MDRPATRIGLTAAERRRVEASADRLEAAWDGADTVALEPLLPPADDPLRPTVLRELVKTDLEIRWRRGRPIQLERYLEQYPELAAPPSDLAELLYEEYRVRQRHGDRPPLDSYQPRFPGPFEELRRLVRDHPVPTFAGVVSTPADPAGLPASAVVMQNNQILPVGGGYMLEELIGRGGFGEVWRAKAPGGFLVALKIIRRPADHEERIREVSALKVVAQLHHHFLIQTHAFFAEPNELIIAMDLADCSLRDRLKECRNAGQSSIPAPELVAYFREAAEALDYLHAKDVLHRDIKPDNILLLEGHVRLADFGLVRLQNEHLVSVSGSGTAAYMPPEVWKGKAGPMSDQYSLAYAYAELRLGRRPFTSGDYASLMMDHLAKPPNLDPLVPAERQVLLQALAKEPEDRFPTCLDFVRALERVLGETTDSPTFIPGSSNAPPVASRPPAADKRATHKGDDRPASLPDASAFGDDEETGTERLGSLLAGQRSRPAPANASSLGDKTAPPPPAPVKPERRRPWKGFLAFLVGAGVVVAGLTAFAVWSNRPQDHPQTAAGFALTAPAPLALRAGEKRNVTVAVKREHFDGEIRLTFTTPPHVAAADAVVAAGAQSAEVEVAVAADAVPGDGTVVIHGAAGNLTGDAEMRLTISRSNLSPPPGFKPGADGAVETDPATGREFYKEITTSGSDYPETTFVLILHGKGGEKDPPTFYAMKTKVSNELMAALQAGAAAEKWPRSGPKARLPAFGMTAKEAREAAQRLGGLLPTKEQWDKAAGFSQRAGHAGPSPTGARVAVGLMDDGPLPVDASEDVSPLGVRDTAGNGTEFTRDLLDVKRGPADPPPLDRLVILRGRRFTALKPMLYADLEEQQTTPQVQYEGKGSPYTGFRVVMEPPG